MHKILYVMALALSSSVLAGTPYTHIGTDGPDTMMGTSGNDKMRGKRGGDFINGLGGDDIIEGGRGDDMLIGDNTLADEGDDQIWGGDGKDTINGGWGNDFLRGGDHDDNIYGWYGDDDIYGGSGDDYIDGGCGDDRLRGGSGNNHIIDTCGNNSFYIKGVSTNFIESGSGDDTYIITGKNLKGTLTLSDQGGDNIFIFEDISQSQFESDYVKLDGYEIWASTTTGEQVLIIETPVGDVQTMGLATFNFKFEGASPQ